MAKVFLDTNVYIDAVHRKTEINRQFTGHKVFYSTLSTHILFYASKLKVPHQATRAVEEEFEIIDFTSSILENALAGPTPDLEDNIQLHSAAEAECDYFLTSDKKLLSMKFFGKVQIVDRL